MLLRVICCNVSFSAVNDAQRAPRASRRSSASVATCDTWCRWFQLISTDFNWPNVGKGTHHDVARLCADSSVIHGNSLSNTVTTECLRFQNHNVFYMFIQLYNARVALSHIDPLLDSLGPGDFQLLIYKGTGRSKKCGKMTVRQHLPAVHRLPVAESRRFWICKSHIKSIHSSIRSMKSTAGLSSVLSARSLLSPSKNLEMSKEQHEKRRRQN